MFKKEQEVGTTVGKKERKRKNKIGLQPVSKSVEQEVGFFKNFKSLVIKMWHQTKRSKVKKLCNKNKHTKGALNANINVCNINVTPCHFLL